MTPMERLEAARAIVAGLPGNSADQLTIAMLAMAMTMRLAAGDNEEVYLRLKASASHLMDVAPPFSPDLETTPHRAAHNARQRETKP